MHLILCHPLFPLQETELFIQIETKGCVGCERQYVSSPSAQKSLNNQYLLTLFVLDLYSLKPFGLKRVEIAKSVVEVSFFVVASVGYRPGLDMLRVHKYVSQSKYSCQIF